MLGSKTSIGFSKFYIWSAHEDQVSPLAFNLTKEQLEKDQEMDNKMDQTITNFNFSKYFIRASAQSVNDVGVKCVNLDESKFEAEVNFHGNQSGGYC